MNRFVIAAAAVVALTGAVALSGSRAEAMSLHAPLAGATQQTEQVRLVCSTRRVGMRLVKTCRDVRPAFRRPVRVIRPHGHRH